MAYRHREKIVADGESIDPNDWIEQMRAYAGEFNGHLDRDNFPIRVFQRTQIKKKQINSFQSKVKRIGHEEFKVGGGTTSFQTAPEAITFEADTDGVMTVWWSGCYQWNTGTAPRDIIAPQGTDNLLFAVKRHNNRQCHGGHLTPYTQHYMGLRILVNGQEISTSRFNTWLRNQDSFYLTGVIPISPGQVKILPQVRIFAIQGSNGDLRLTDGPVNATLLTRELVYMYKRR